MKQQPFNLDASIAMLERIPASLSALLNGLPDTWILATEGEGSWSAIDVIGHLIHGERVDWISRARHILSGETQPFETFDRNAQFAESKDESLFELLLTFTELRHQNIITLRGLNLTVADLERKGLHPELGEVTLRQLLATWVVHDLDHVGQIARTMAKAYGEATGPWAAYLSILRDRT